MQSAKSSDFKLSLDLLRKAGLVGLDRAEGLIFEVRSLVHSQSLEHTAPGASINSSLDIMRESG